MVPKTAGAGPLPLPNDVNDLDIVCSTGMSPVLASEAAVDGIKLIARKRTIISTIKTFLRALLLSIFFHLRLYKRKRREDFLCPSYFFMI